MPVNNHELIGAKESLERLRNEQSSTMMEGGRRDKREAKMGFRVLKPFKTF